MSQPRYQKCIVILADGSRPDILMQMAGEGKLPHIQKYLAEPGTNQAMLSVFPSTTGPAYLPYLTGCFPGTCNVPGIRWFDKDHYAEHGWSFKSFRSYCGLETFLLNRDMTPGIGNAFEVFNKPVSILNMIYKGVPKGLNKTKHSRIWYYYYAHLTDKWAFIDQAMCRKLLKSLKKEDPDFAFVVFPGIDEYSHRSSPFHPRTLKAYEELDDYVGQIVTQLKITGQWEQTLLMIVSDHGHSETKVHFDVGPYLEEEKGLKTFFYSNIFKRNFKASTMVSGNGMCHVYLKSEAGWKGRTTYEEIAHTTLLLEDFRLRPEISLVAACGEDDAIHVLTEKGHGHFKITDDQVTYQWDKDDPLDIFPNNDNKKVVVSLDDSLRQSFDSHYPDVFMQLKQLFSSPRSGDIVLSANPGYDLRDRYEHPEHKSSHGAICPDHMKVPFVTNHRIDIDRPIRSVDIYPTILKLMGKEIPDGIDGRSLV